MMEELTAAEQLEFLTQNIRVERETVNQISSLTLSPDLTRELGYFFSVSDILNRFSGNLTTDAL